MAETITLRVNGRPVTIRQGATVAAAIVSAGISAFRLSVSGLPRGPLCGMGICFECRATVDGIAHTRTCQMIAREAMEVSTDAS